MQTRKPSSTLDEVNATFALSIKSSDIRPTNGNLEKFYLGLKPDPNILNYVFEKTEGMSEDTAFKFKMDFVGEKKILKILYNEKSFNDALAVFELDNFLVTVKNDTNFFTRTSFWELMYNVEHDDSLAIDNFLKFRSKYSTQIGFEGFGELDPETFNQRLDSIKVKREEYQSVVKDFNKQKKILEASRRTLMDTLDKAPESEQLKSMVARNDRKGVVELLKKYLPFEQMPPFEKRFWDMQLEVMLHPTPLGERVLIYRGLSDDFIHSAIVDGVELSKESAIRDSRAFVMSTVLVKNQGSWNRRLRSLQTMYEKYIVTDRKGSDEYTKSARVTTMFCQHSAEPKGSPFLSFTPRFKIAKSFGSKRMASFLVDPRIINYNLATKFGSEKEFLMPLVTFPDELVGFWDEKIDGVLPDIEIMTLLNRKLLARLETKYSKNEAPQIIESILKRSDVFFNPVYTEQDKTFDSGNFDEVMKKIINDVSEKLDPNHAPITPVKPIIIEKTGLSCLEMVKSFWAVP
jgi:hypothetical protein